LNIQANLYPSFRQYLLHLIFSNSQPSLSAKTIGDERQLNPSLAVMDTWRNRCY